MIHRVKGFSIVNEAEVDFFLEFSCFFYDPTKIMASDPITSWQINEEIMETVRDFWGGAPKSLQTVIAAMELTDACPLEEKP